MRLRHVLHALGKPSGFRAEKQAVFRGKGEMLHRVPAPCAGGHKPPACAVGGKIRLQRRPYAHIHMRPVIKPSPAQMPVVDGKAQRLDEVQPRARSRAQAGDVAGVRRNFRVIKNNVQHEYALPRLLNDAASRRVTG